MANKKIKASEVTEGTVIVSDGKEHVVTFAITLGNRVAIDAGTFAANVSVNSKVTIKE